MSATVIGPYHAGEIPPTLTVIFEQSSGAVIDFTQSGPWTAQFSYRSYGGTWTTKTATVSGGSTGAVTYAWVAADLATPGDYEGEMWVGNGGLQRYDSVRLAWQVLPAVSPTPTL